jgi:hypothetical protein
MDNTIKQINIEEIMTEIRHEIKEKGYKNKVIVFNEIPIYSLAGDMEHSGALDYNLIQISSQYAVAAYRPLGSSRISGALVVFFKKVIRKLTKFYIEPIVADQNENNRLMTFCIRDLFLEINELRSKVKCLEDDVSKLKKKKND